MRRVLIPPKYVSEVRRDVIDMTPDLFAGQTLSTVSATVSVYSGIDSSPVVVVPTVSSNQVFLATSGGTVGVIYSVTVQILTSTPALTLVVTYLLAVIPDAV